MYNKRQQDLFFSGRSCPRRPEKEALFLNTKSTFQPQELQYLQLLAKQYPTVQAASTEIINLQAILGLPKGTEHFISDIHGEYEAFLHILNSCSGVVKEKLDELFGTTMTRAERDQLATLIYYPEEKLKLITAQGDDLKEWYRITLHRLIEVCRWAASVYTRSKVRKALPRDYAYIIDELLHVNYDEADKRDYYENIINTIIDIDQAPGFIIAVCGVIKRMAVDRLHIVGDIFDRGPRADIVMDALRSYHSVDIQWGNHDILWMGAASGSRTLVATVLANSIHYNNLEVIETGYGISLRPLSIFANEVYKDCDTHRFAVKLTGADAGGQPSQQHLRRRLTALFTVRSPLSPDLYGDHRLQLLSIQLPRCAGPGIEDLAQIIAESHGPALCGLHSHRCHRAAIPPGPLVRVGVQRRHPLRRQGGDHCIPDLTQLPHSAASRSCSSAAQ